LRERQDMRQRFWWDRVGLVKFAGRYRRVVGLPGRVQTVGMSEGIYPGRVSVGAVEVGRANTPAVEEPPSVSRQEYPQSRPDTQPDSLLYNMDRQRHDLEVSS
jgi:hypothetical protein